MDLDKCHEVLLESSVIAMHVVHELQKAKFRYILSSSYDVMFNRCELFYFIVLLKHNNRYVNC